MDIEKLRLTYDEVYDITSGVRSPLIGFNKVRDAQLAKALWGLVDFCDKECMDKHVCCAHAMKSWLEKAGIPHPEVKKSEETTS